jgi:hypothetical protein
VSSNGGWIIRSSQSGLVGWTRRIQLALTAARMTGTGTGTRRPPMAAATDDGVSSGSAAKLNAPRTSPNTARR